MHIYGKLALIQAVFLLFQSVVYFGVQKPERYVHDVKRPIDNRIPFVSQAIFGYGIWYPLIAVFPLILYHASPVCYVIYMVSILEDIIVSAAIYLVYPTSFKRPQASEKTLSGKLLGWIHTKGNYKGKNCMPSMHCSMCYIIMIFVVACGSMVLWIRVAVILIAVLIVISTLLTKQHVLIDVITAIPVSAVCCLIGYWVCRIGGII